MNNLQVLMNRSRLNIRVTLFEVELRERSEACIYTGLPPGRRIGRKDSG